MDANALILFTDARGFTRWANNPEVFSRLDRFAHAFMAALRKAFPRDDYFVKGLGDGAMIVHELKKDVDAKGAGELLERTIRIIDRVQQDFQQTCQTFAESIGHPTELSLGWGVVRGPVQHIKSPEDYVGPNVNKASRLCGIARPFGIVVDRDDFPQLPSERDVKFFEQTRFLTGLTEPVQVWVTEEIASGFLTREKLRQVPEVHVTGHCIDTSSKRTLKVLIAKRAPGRRLYPNLYEGCGGQLAASETFAEGVRRHFRMEMHIDVSVLERYHCFYAIREPEEKVIPGIRFLCERVGDEEPHSHNHTEVKWVTEKELRSMSGSLFIPRLKEEVIDLLEQYKRS